MQINITDFNMIDITIVILVLLMSIKGFINGFLREIFGFIGLIGGVFIASRTSEFIAKQIDTNLLHLENFATLELIGFLAVLAVSWGLSVLIGNTISGPPEEREHSTLGRVFGFVTAGIKYFLIFALILSALFRSPLLKEDMTKSVTQSQLYPTMDKLGSVLINLTPIGDKIQVKKKEKP